MQFLTYFASLQTPNCKLSSKLLEFTHFVQFYSKEGQINDNDEFSLFFVGENSLDLRVFSV